MQRSRPDAKCVENPWQFGLSKLQHRLARHDSICFLMEPFAALTISRKAASTGLEADFRHDIHKGIRVDCGVIGRTTACGRFRLRTQLGMSDTPRPLSTSVITVAIKFGSFTMRGEKPARRQTETTSSNRPGAPLRLNCTNGSPVYRI